jgi:hypothetical protein
MMMVMVGALLQVVDIDSMEILRRTLNKRRNIVWISLKENQNHSKSVV